MASLQLQAIKRSKMITALGAMLWIWGVQMRWKIRINNWFSLFSWVRLHPRVTVWIRPCIAERTHIGVEKQSKHMDTIFSFKGNIVMWDLVL
jgi:hypothetical protein